MTTIIYDAAIKKHHAYFQLPYDWRLIKAQLVQESNLIPTAKSQAGAIGLAQFMPGTWDDMARELKMPPGTLATNADYSIKACCYFMGKLLNSWKAEREAIDRYCLALASYNAGMGNIIAAQKIANGVTDYASIINQLALVTGHQNAKQTRDYVQKILGNWQDFIINGDL